MGVRGAVIALKLPTGMRMSGFIAARRLDNSIKGDELGNDNLSHNLFFVKLAIRPFIKILAAMCR
jgi:hypothetical protein